MGEDVERLTRRRRSRSRARAQAQRGVELRGDSVPRCRSRSSPARSSGNARARGVRSRAGCRRRAAARPVRSVHLAVAPGTDAAVGERQVGGAPRAGADRREGPRSRAAPSAAREGIAATTRARPARRHASTTTTATPLPRARATPALHGGRRERGSLSSTARRPARSARRRRAGRRARAGSRDEPVPAVEQHQRDAARAVAGLRVRANAGGARSGRARRHVHLGALACDRRHGAGAAQASVGAAQHVALRREALRAPHLDAAVCGHAQPLVGRVGLGIRIRREPERVAPACVRDAEHQLSEPPARRLGLELLEARRAHDLRARHTAVREQRALRVEERECLRTGVRGDQREHQPDRQGLAQRVGKRARASFERRAAAAPQAPARDRSTGDAQRERVAGAQLHGSPPAARQASKARRTRKVFAIRGGHRVASNQRPSALPASGGGAGPSAACAAAPSPLRRWY